MLGKNDVTKLNTLPKSNDTVRQKISDVSDDIQNLLIAEIKDALLGIFMTNLIKLANI